MTDNPIFELQRDFAAPRNLVWRTWTEPELLSHWYGPGVDTTIHELDVRPGGVWRNEMSWGDKSNFERMDYKEVEPAALLVWHHSVTDANWNIIDNPMMPNWPRVLLTTVTFADAADGKTTVKLTWEPYQATDAERDAFRQAMSGLGMGWGKGWDLLAEMLDRMGA